MHKYIAIETKEDMHLYEAMITSLFSEVLHIDHTKVDTHILWIYYDHEIDISLKDVIINLSQDTLLDIRLYESYQFEHLKDLEDNRSFIEQKLKLINFNKYVYLDDHIIVMHFIKQLDKSFKAFVFKKYLDDYMMQETLKIYLESNQNMSQASKNLYIHRNTLTQRLDKFLQITGFDARKFMDGLLIYHLLII